VKPGFYSFLNHYVSHIAIILCFLPFVLVFWKKINREKAYLLIGIYWLITGLINIPENWLGLAQNKELQDNITLVDNLLDTPLMLLVFYFSSQMMKKKMLLYMLAIFIPFEVVMVIWKGFNFDSITIIIGAGALITLLYSIWGLAQYFQKIEHTAFEATMGFAYAGFLFYYGVFMIIYIFNYLDYNKDTVQVNLFFYYLSLILATALTCIGIWRYTRPKLNKLFH
jgi:hypothetical protein